MQFCERHGTSAEVQAAEQMLEVRPALRAGQRGRLLVRRKCLAVSTAERLDVAELLEQTRPVRVAERERQPEMIGRRGVRGEAASRCRRRPVNGRRPVRLAGRGQVRRQLSGARQVRLAAVQGRLERRGGRSVELAAAREPRRRLRRGARRVGRESVLVLPLGWLGQHAGADELVERGRGIRLVRADNRGRERRVERVTQDRGGLHQPPRDGRQRGRARRGSHVGRTGRLRRRCRRRCRPADDRAMQLGRLGLRPYPELRLEEPSARLVLANRAGAVTARDQQPHQRPVRGFVERVERHEAPGGGDPVTRPALRRFERHQPSERDAQLAAERLGLERLPLVPRRAVPEAEALEEVATMDVDGDRQPLSAGRTCVRRRVRVRRVSDERPKVGDVEPDVLRAGIAAKLDLSPVHPEPPAAERGPQHAQRAPERSASVIRVRLRPEQLGQRLARDRPADDGDVGEQRDRLARVHGDRPPVRDDLWRAKKDHPERQAISSLVPGCQPKNNRSGS